MIRIEPVNWGSDRKHEAQELGKEDIQYEPIRISKELQDVDRNR